MDQKSGVDRIASGVTLDPAGYWIAPAVDEVSYPSEGNDFCLSVEESSFWFAHRNRVILAAMKRWPPGSGPLLDVGAGNGFVSAALSRAGFDIIAIEPHRAGAANAVQRGVSPVVCASLPGPSFRQGVAGGIALFDVVEHVEHDRAFLSSLRPYLRSGGRVYVTTPAYRWLWSLEDVAAGHYRRYTLRSLRSVFRDAGYTVEYATYIFSWLPLPTFLFRRLPSLLRGHSTEGFEPSAGAHRAGGAGIRRLLEASFAFEAPLVRRRVRIPFGASCLLVARSD